MPKRDKQKDECIQLKNINYQSMLQKKNTPIDSGKMVTDNIDEYLIQEQRDGHKQKAWSKLEKGIKLKRLYKFIEILTKKFSLTEKEVLELKKYMKTSLERKKLQRIKDVTYDSMNNIIKEIPGLTFNETNRKFILRKIDKKGTTIKCLAPKNSTKRKSKRRKKSDKRKTERKKKKTKNKTKNNTKNTKNNKIENI